MEASTDYFISLIECNRVLYDKSSKDFKNVVKKDEAWARIARNTKSTVAEVKKRYASLRQKYCREKQKLEIQRRTKSKPVNPWVFFDRFQFLDEYIRPRTTYTNDSGFDDMNGASSYPDNNSTISLAIQNAATNEEDVEMADFNNEDIDDENAASNGDGLISGESNGDGLNDGESNGEGSNGGGSNGDGSNDDGSNGDGSNGDGSNGGHSNGSGSKGSGSSRGIVRYSPEDVQDSDSFQFIDSSGMVNVAVMSKYSGELTSCQVPPDNIEEIGPSSSVRDSAFNTPSSPRPVNNSANKHIMQKARVPPTSSQGDSSRTSREPTTKKVPATRPISHHGRVPNNIVEPLPKLTPISSTEQSTEAMRHKLDNCIASLSAKISEKNHRSPHAPFLAYLGTKLPNVPKTELPRLEKQILDLVDSFDPI